MWGVIFTIQSHCFVFPFIHVVSLLLSEIKSTSRTKSILYFAVYSENSTQLPFVKTFQVYLWSAAILNVYARGRTRMSAVSGHIIVVLSSLSAARCDVWEWRIAALRCCCWCRCQWQEGAFDIHYISLPQCHIMCTVWTWRHKWLISIVLTTFMYLHEQSNITGLAYSYIGTAR